MQQPTSSNGYIVLGFSLASGEAKRNLDYILQMDKTKVEKGTR